MLTDLLRVDLQRQFAESEGINEGDIGTDIFREYIPDSSWVGEDQFLDIRAKDLAAESEDNLLLTCGTGEIAISLFTVAGIG